MLFVSSTDKRKKTILQDNFLARNFLLMKVVYDKNKTNCFQTKTNLKSGTFSVYCTDIIHPVITKIQNKYLVYCTKVYIVWLPQQVIISMPFWKKDMGNGKSKEKVNYKARLEHKQYLVSQDLEEEKEDALF